MKFSTLAAFVGTAVAGQSDSYFATSGYQGLSASAKSDQIWSQVVADTTSWSFPLKVGIFAESMAPTFEYVADAMPKTWTGATRTKFIHSVGVVSKCKFVSTGDHPFTGIFEGADYGFCRLSCATDPVTDKKLAPGLSLKFLRKGVPSSDLVAVNYDSIYLPDGDWNFFSKDISNHIASPDGTARKLVADKFAIFTDYTNEVGLSGYSDYD